MSNATKTLRLFPFGKDGRQINMPVDGGAVIYGGTLVAQLAATGMLVAGSTAGSGPCCGVAEHDQDATGVGDAVKRCMIMTDEIFMFAGKSGDAPTEATPLGTVVYAEDDHTIALTAGSLFQAGLFMGIEPDGKIRVLVTPLRSLLIDAVV